MAGHGGAARSIEGEAEAKFRRSEGGALRRSPEAEVRRDIEVERGGARRRWTREVERGGALRR